VRRIDITPTPATCWRWPMITAAACTPPERLMGAADVC
jgi:hypothetical protein